MKATLDVRLCRRVLFHTMAASATCDLWCTVLCVFVLCVSSPHVNVSKVERSLVSVCHLFLGWQDVVLTCCLLKL